MAHFLNFSDFSADVHAKLLARAAAIKAEVAGGERRWRLAGHTLLMLFEKPSTRTRASFIAAMAQSGGVAVELAPETLQTVRGETLADTARVLSAYGDALLIRAKRHADIEEFAAHATCPVINGLSDVAHPCQVLADVMTFYELRGELAGKTIAWVGDCNNVLRSWAQASALFGCRLQVACPPAYRCELPVPAVFVGSPHAAAAGAALVITDVWISMGDLDEQRRREAFVGYTVTPEVMAAAQRDALFMHCLPAHRGEEVAAAVIDGAQSAVWRQAENRLHAQKALLMELLAVDS